jgi:hypothetical protein
MHTGGPGVYDEHGMTFSRSRFAAVINIYIISSGLVTAPTHAQSSSRNSPGDPNRIVEAAADANGRVVLKLQSGRYIRPVAEKEQKGSEQIRIDERGHAVGWLVDDVTCCQSYVLPSTLIVYRVGKPVRVFGNGLVLIDWQFVDADSQVQFSSSQAHGIGANWLTVEVHDIETGRLLKKWQEPADDTVRRKTTLLAIKGQARDEFGKPVSNAFVNIRFKPGAESFAVSVTDSAGQFKIPNVEPGQYEVRFERRGFKQRVMSLTVPPSGDSVDVGSVGLESNPAEAKTPGR